MPDTQTVICPNTVAALLRMAEAIERNCPCVHCGSAADRLRREAKQNG